MLGGYSLYCVCALVLTLPHVCPSTVMCSVIALEVLLVTEHSMAWTALFTKSIPVTGWLVVI